MMDALGAIPIQIPFARIIDAFRRKVVDCAIAGMKSGVETGLPEVTSHISPMAISWGSSFFGANREAWNQIPANVREQLRDEIRRLETTIREASDREIAVGLACNTGGTRDAKEARSTT
jgi:TRAP-type C4-dicarboxylate transport system substrate-binding protein